MTVPAEEWSVGEARTERDLEDVLEIERTSFENPWTWEMLRGELMNAPVSRIYLLRNGAGRTLGFCSVWVVEDELHINNLAVDPEWRRMGAGRAIMNAVLERAARLGCRTATLEVRRSNAAARALYEGLGFGLIGIRKGYYTKPDEDALVLGKVGLLPRAAAGNRS
ncbi:MAG: ribosomal protein S18-alanine N-acetyltransferase [Vicinamibacterales bacterium]